MVTIADFLTNIDEWPLLARCSSIMRYDSLRAPTLQGFYTAQSLDMGIQALPLPLWWSHVPPLVPYIKFSPLAISPPVLVLTRMAENQLPSRVRTWHRGHSHIFTMPVRYYSASHPPYSALPLSPILFLSAQKDKKTVQYPLYECFSKLREYEPVFLITVQVWE